MIFSLLGSKQESHLDIPQDHAFIATLYKFAEQHNIKYILNGGNFSTECVRNPMEFFYYGTDMIHIVTSSVAWDY